MVRMVLMAEYIDLEALEKAMTIAAVNGKDKDRRTWAKAICVLHDMQTADVAPVRHGQWDDSFDGITPYCSVCGRSHRGMIRTPKYCPNCGAKMDERGGNNA